MFLERIAVAVEARHYPNDVPGVDLSIAHGLAAGLKLLRIALLLNLIALPVYVLFSIFLPGLNLFVFYGLNGYLLGREYFELVALRHLDKAAALELRKRYRWRLFAAGVVMTFLFTVPIVNLVTPLITTAAMVHIFKGLEVPRGRGGMM
jgi:CysZ protein